MKNLLLKGMIVSCALSVSAMEEVQVGTTGEPLKFQMNQENGSIEDAPGSNFISTFRESVQRVDKMYNVLEEKVQGDLTRLDEALKELQPDSSGYKGTALYRKKLVGKIEKVKEKRANNSKLELFLQKILTAIHKPTESVPFSRDVSVPVPNFEILTAKPFKDIELDFSYNGGMVCIESIGKSYLPLQIESPLPVDLSSQLYHIFQHHQLPYKLKRTQKEMFNCAELIYHVITDTCSSLEQMKRMQIKVYTQMADDEGKSVLVILNDEMEAYNKKAEEKIFPGLEVHYWMAKTIMAFEKEAARFRSLTQSAG